MRVLLINSFYYPNVGGGAEITVKDIAEGLVARGHSVAVLCTHNENKLMSEDVGGVLVYRMPIKNIYWGYGGELPGKFKRIFWHWRDKNNKNHYEFIKKVIDDFKPDVASCHNLSGISIAAWDCLIDSGVNFNQVLHDYYLICPSTAMYKNDSICGQQCGSCYFFRREHVHKSNFVKNAIGVSKYILDKHVGNGLFEKSNKVVIYNGKSINTDINKKIKKQKEKIVFGFIGSLTRKKGIELLVDSFPLSIDFDNVELIVGGRGDVAYVDELKARAFGKNIKFVGHVSSAEFYKSIDVLVVPSLWAEPLGGVVIEGRANNLVVLASNCGGIPEILSDCDKCFIFDPACENSLAIEIRKILESDIEIFCGNSSDESFRDVFLNKYRMISQYEDVLMNAIGLRSFPTK